MDRNPVRDKLRAGGTPMGVMVFDFFSRTFPTPCRASFAAADCASAGSISTVVTSAARCASSAVK